MMKMRSVALIPARGGSKRLPDKNILPLGGKPLLSHSIEYAIKSGVIDDVFVSTDDERISRIAETFGAKVIWRPKLLSSDLATTASAVQHSAKKLVENGIDFDMIVLLQATNPLRPESLLNEAIDLMNEGDYDSLVTFSPLARKLGKIEQDNFTPWNYTYGQRSQDMEPLYFENGLLYISKKELTLQGQIFGNKVYPFVVDSVLGSIDIDTIDDFELAEFYYNKLDK